MELWGLGTGETQHERAGRSQGRLQELQPGQGKDGPATNCDREACRQKGWGGPFRVQLHMCSLWDIQIWGQATGYMSLEFRTEVQVEIEMWESPAYGSYLESRNWKRSPSRDIDRKRSQALKPSIVKRSRRWGEISKGWTSKTRKTRFLEAEQWTGFKEESTIDYWMQLMSQGGRGRGRSTCT